jgi:hypothetical protein
MKNTIFLFTTLVFSIILLISCKNIETKNEISKIDSLSNLLEKAQKKQLEINFKDINLLSDSVKIYIDTLVKYLDKIPVNKEHKEYFTLFTNLRKDLKDFNKIKISEDLDYSIEQLTDLKEDVISKSITKEQFTTYFKDEELATIILIQKSDYQHNTWTKFKSDYANYKPHIIEIIDSLKQSK